MQDVHQAIEALGDAIGLGQAALDANGYMTLTVDNNFQVNFARIDNEAFELWTPLSNLGSPTDASLLSALLAANHLGEGAGAARLAMTPDRTGFVLCERIVIGPIDIDGLVDRLSAFIRYATFWASPAAIEATGRSTGAPSLPADDFGFVIRA